MLDMASWLLLKGVLNICKYIGYKNCARMATLSLGKRIVKYSVSSALSGFGIPMRLVNTLTSAAPYAPAVVVLATGGVGGIATSASFIALSQITDYLFIFAIKTAVTTGTSKAFKVVKYVFSTKRSATTKPDPKKRAELEDNWVMIIEEEEETDEYKVVNAVDYQMEEGEDILVKQGLESVEKALDGMDTDKVSFVEEESIEEEGFVIVKNSKG